MNMSDQAIINGSNHHGASRSAKCLKAMYMTIGAVIIEAKNVTRTDIRSRLLFMSGSVKRSMNDGLATCPSSSVISLKVYM
jgi:hypothetical protein